MKDNREDTQACPAFHYGFCTGTLEIIQARVITSHGWRSYTVNQSLEITKQPQDYLQVLAQCNKCGHVFYRNDPLGGILNDAAREKEVALWPVTQNEVYPPKYYNPSDDDHT